MPRLKGLPEGRFDERAGYWGFWLMSLGVLGMSLGFAVAGVLQTYLERIRGEPYMVAQQPMRFWMVVVVLHGVMVVAGVAVTVKHLLTLRPASASAESEEAAPRRAMAT
ncbi:MAG TPA: nitric-oxide reductase, partial [Anaeromyxobacteraceae bacterium]|nr:nitric-oxide reductase [Anaeromyxobacteraceae bacterium]